MSDLSIIAANVLAGTAALTKVRTAGIAVTAGQVVYLEGATDTCKLADCDSATAEVRSPLGIALNNAAAGQPLVVLEEGPITIGATLAPGVTYYLSPNPGAICPVADVLTGDHTVIIGMATSATVLEVNIQESGVAI